MRAGESLSRSPMMPKYIHAYEHIPVMTGEEIKFLMTTKDREKIQEDNPGLMLRDDQPLPMEDALNESIKGTS